MGVFARIVLDYRSEDIKPLIGKNLHNIGSTLLQESDEGHYQQVKTWSINVGPIRKFGKVFTATVTLSGYFPQQETIQALLSLHGWQRYRDKGGE